MLAQKNETAWLSITKVKDWAEMNMAPVTWSCSRKASYEVEPLGDGTNVWPWYVQGYMYAEEKEISTNKWHHIVISVNGAKSGKDGYGYSVKGTVTGTTYVDGKVYGTGPVAKYVMTKESKIYLGINGWDVMQKGYFDDIAIFDYALEDSQVKALYEKQSGN